MSELEQLKWQQEMGAEDALAETPTNHLETPPPVKEVISPAEKTITPKPAPISSPLQAAADAQTLADNCQNLSELEAAVKAFDGCALKKTATNTVFSDGNPNAKLMLIGEAPGANEDEQGIPFCGVSGKLLDTMFSHAGFTRKDSFYITNTIFWRPPGNRKPTPEEIAVCKPFVERHIALIDPEFIVLVGSTAATGVLDAKLGITKLRGQILSYKNKYLAKDIPAMAIFHPSYLLRQPSQKRFTWQDLLAIKQQIQTNAI